MSPPSPHRLFCVTHRTALVVIAASATFPPCALILAPAIDAAWLEEATTPFVEKELGLVLILTFSSGRYMNYFIQFKDNEPIDLLSSDKKDLSVFTMQNCESWCYRISGRRDGTYGNPVQAEG
jgi:hypothetical protein